VVLLQLLIRVYAVSRWYGYSIIKFVLKLNGVSEIDVQSVELLPGASSALYGANAFEFYS
jgi:hypothetical protein